MDLNFLVPSNAFPQTMILGEGEDLVWTTKAFRYCNVIVSKVSFNSGVRVGVLWLRILFYFLITISWYVTQLLVVHFSHNHDRRLSCWKMLLPETKDKKQKNLLEAKPSRFHTKNPKNWVFILSRKSIMELFLPKLLMAFSR